MFINPQKLTMTPIGIGDRGDMSVIITIIRGFKKHPDIPGLSGFHAPKNVDIQMGEI
jgi:hypothetical protein